MKYTKAHLEKIVLAQLDNIQAMSDLLITVKAQTELIRKANKKLADEINMLGRKQYALVGRKKKAKAAGEAG